jgi:hypothetical protein
MASKSGRTRQRRQGAARRRRRQLRDAFTRPAFLRFALLLLAALLTLGGRTVSNLLRTLAGNSPAIPLAAGISGANVPEVKALIPVVDSIGPVGGKPGRPKQRMAVLNTAHGSGLGVFRWVAERTLSWMHGFRKLRLVTDKGLDMQYAFDRTPKDCSGLIKTEAP